MHSKPCARSSSVSFIEKVVLPDDDGPEMNTALTVPFVLISVAMSEMRLRCSASDSLIVSCSVPSAIFLFRSPSDSIESILA